MSKFFFDLDSFVHFLEMVLIWERNYDSIYLDYNEKTFLKTVVDNNFM